MKNTKTISKDVLKYYFDLQEELYNIQQDKKHWPENWTYEDMCNRVNKLNIIIRNVAKSINYN